MIGDPELKVAKAYDMLPEGAGTTSEGRTAADNATVRSVFVIGPDKKIKAMLTYPMSTGRNFDEVLRLLDSLPAHRQAHGGDAGELEARRGRHHPAGGLRRAGQGEVPERLEDAEALSAHRRRSRSDAEGVTPSVAEGSFSSADSAQNPVDKRRLERRFLVNGPRFSDAHF